VRAERAIKLVRSDVAAHVLPKSTTATTTNEDMAVEEVVDEQTAVVAIVQEELKEGEHLERIDETKPEEVPLGADDKEVVAGASSVERTEIWGEEQPRPPSAAASLETAVAHTAVAAITAPAAISRVRSHSADPDKSSRVSRAYVDSTTDQTTGDESSASTTGHLSPDRRRRTPRKKQQQQALTKERSHRKVVINDFEMLRVLGKGCAGKVLLVRHKPTSELYALKAITKRHVLAHQELQHTLTEQAVLKRMAAEGRDPFVVKLWWSFHDKENLFLVMVRGLLFLKPYAFHLHLFDN
jgi:serum/glucocorticoid-regulated kinase 2